MSAQHTPGPWVWRNKSGSLHAAPPAGSPYKYGAPVLTPEYEPGAGCDTIVSDADAALIAAAPDLLGGLEVAAAESHWIAGPPVLSQMRAAIAKARNT